TIFSHDWSSDVCSTDLVTDAFGGNCVSCHSQEEAKWDMVCEAGHGCEPTGMTPMMAKALQNTDPRCGRLVLPAAQLRALSDHASSEVRRAGIVIIYL